MVRHEEIEGSRQLLVFGGGLTPVGELSAQSVERTVAAARYTCNHLSDIVQVTFTGGQSIIAPDSPEGAREAPAMTDLFVELTKGEVAPGLIKIEAEGRTSLDNVAKSSSLLVPDVPVGRVSHLYHQPRLKMITDCSLEQATFPVAAESEQSADKVPVSEYVLRAVTKALLLGVRQGDIDVLTQRAEMEAALFSVSPKRFVRSLMRDHVFLQV